MNRKERRKLIYSISDHLDSCEVCTIKREMLDASPNNARTHSKIQKHCNKECARGEQLQELGKQLGRGEDNRGSDTKAERKSYTLGK